MSIRNIEDFLTGVWDWGWLEDLFSNRCRISDIDGVIERNGCFYFFECKRTSELHARQPGKPPVPTGQHILLKRLSALPRVRCMVLWGDVDEPGGVPVITHAASYHDGAQWGEVYPFSNGALRRELRRWWDYANNHNKGIA